MAIFQRNRRIKHKFIFSALLFYFCVIRAVALTLRIAWSATAATRGNVSLAIASGVLVSAGVLLLFIVNLILARRVLRARLPRVGWGGVVGWVWTFLIGSVVAVLIMLVICFVHSLFTLDMSARDKERQVLLFAGVYLTVMAFLPVPVVLVAWFVPIMMATPGKKPGHEMEEFGTGRMGTKVALLVGTSLLLTLGAGFRAAVNFVPRPPTQPAWYHSKEAFYCFNFVIEVIVVYVFAIARFDRRFHVPDGSSGPGDYSKGAGVELGGILDSSKAESALGASAGEESYGGYGHPRM
jgi:hypothetical protein